MDLVATAQQEFEAALERVPPAVRAALMKVRTATSPVELWEAEREAHDAAKKETDGLCGLALQARVLDPEFVEEARAEARAQADEAGIRIHSKGTRRTLVRHRGGMNLPLLALLMLPATPKDPEMRKKRGERGPGGAGVFPALAKLGIMDRATPGLRESVAFQVASCTSVDMARRSLERQEIAIDHKAALRLTYSFGQAALEGRNQAMASCGEGPAAAESELTGRRVVVSLDGGRLRLKEPKLDADPEDRRFNAEWREPKVLTIYLVDEHGRRDPKFRPLIDATMGDADHVADLLIGYLRLLGARHAAHVLLIADGGPWIWARAKRIRDGAGIEPERWSEQLDLCHVIAYLGRKIESLSEAEIDRDGWLAEQKVSLLRGDLAEVEVALRHVSQKHDLDMSCALEFLAAHRSRLCFLFCRPDGQPMGSGAIESAVRRVVNLRLKGNSIYWKRENAEVLLHLRAQLITKRWDEMVRRTLSQPTWKPRT